MAGGRFRYRAGDGMFSRIPGDRWVDRVFFCVPGEKACGNCCRIFRKPRAVSETVFFQEE